VARSTKGAVSTQRVQFAFGDGGDQPGYVNFRLNQIDLPSNVLAGKASSSRLTIHHGVVHASLVP